MGFIKMTMIFAILGTMFLGIATIDAQTNAEFSELVGHWRFDEGSGSIVSDSSGHGNTGKIDGAQWAEEDGRSCLYFDGNDLVRVLESNSLEITDKITLAARIKPNGAQPTQYPSIISKHKGVNPGAQYQLGLGDEGSGYKIRFASEPMLITLGESSVDMNNWSHVAVTYDGNKFVYYLNGVIDKEFIASGSFVNYPADISIGGNLYNMWYFKGYIDDVRVYHEALTSTEIGELSEGASPRSQPNARDLHSPSLSNAIVTPECGKENDQYTFSVVYKDEDGDEPTTANIWIKGFDFDSPRSVYDSGYYSNMEKVSGDITQSATYSYSTQLPAKGEYHYVIYFVNDKGSRVDLPQHGFYDNLGLSGPYVGKECDSSSKPTTEISSLARNPVNAEDLDEYNQIKEYVIGLSYSGPLQIQRIDILQAGAGVAEVVTVQVNSEGKIVKAWKQTGDLGGAAVNAEIGYAIRKSDKPPAAGLEVFIGAEANLGGVDVEGGLKADIDEHGISGGEISGGVGVVGPVSLTGSTSTEGWIGVGNFGIGASILRAMRTGEPTEIDDPNSIPDKIIFDIINAVYGPSNQPLTTDMLKASGTRSDLIVSYYPSDEAKD